MIASTQLIIFFFQAEDGIRALYVTGVQTCALPISGADKAVGGIGKAISGIAHNTPGLSQLLEESASSKIAKLAEIGRASCRERVESSGGAGSGEEKGADEAGGEAGRGAGGRCVAGV